ncbi:hypothetical protein P7C70_g1479, partial [Phenoliferia sp. Uapishka_3]
MSSDDELPPGPGPARPKRVSISTTGQSTSRLVMQESTETQLHFVDHWGFSVRTSSPDVHKLSPPPIDLPSPPPVVADQTSPCPFFELPSSLLVAPVQASPKLPLLSPLDLIKSVYALSPPLDAASASNMEEIDKLDNFANESDGGLATYTGADHTMAYSDGEAHSARGRGMSVDTVHYR